MGFFYAVVVITIKLRNPAILIGYSSLMATILFASGMIMLILGMIGEYIGRIYMNINRIPQYVVKEKINVGGTRA
jgi:undecaprenyl-phosphate 4-deoxy-4-formamido-L-arabinose transferase